MKPKMTARNTRPEPHSREGRIAITKMIMKLFDLWELPVKDHLSSSGYLLGHTGRWPVTGGDILLPITGTS